MIDNEVLRLRRLREAALWTRALARSLDVAQRRTSVFSRSARTCWTISRVITGRLRAHPYLSYQQDAGLISALADKVGSALVGGLARRRSRPVSTCFEQMQSLARVLDDARAVTWSPDFSDTLGRLQHQLRRLVSELEAGARHESGLQAVTQVVAAGSAESTPAATWPYLAL